MEDGRREVWGFGSQECGCLGAPEEGTQRVPYDKPVRLPSVPGRRVRQAVASALASYILDEDGLLFYCGLGIDDGGVDAASTTPTHTLKALSIRDGLTVDSIAEGSSPSHLVVRTTDGNGLSLGLRQIGRGRERRVESFQEILVLGEDLNVEEAAVGYSHTLVTTRNGAVFSFGYAKSGRLGHQDRVDCTIPRLIESLAARKVVSVSCGFNFSLVLLQGGEVLSFGDGYFGQLGHGDTKLRVVPTPISALSTRATAISAGRYHSLVLLEGRVVTFGHRDACVWEPVSDLQEDEHQLLPKPVTHPPAAVAISAGGAHSLALDDQGLVYAWGSNALGGLGQEEDGAKLPPTLVSVPSRAVSISAGQHHSLIIVEYAQ